MSGPALVDPALGSGPLAQLVETYLEIVVGSLYWSELQCRAVLEIVERSL